MTPLIVNHTLLFHWNYLYVLCSSATSRQTVKNQDKRVSPLYQKNTKVFIHASVLTLSVQHIHTHTLTHFCAQSSVQPRLVMLERPPGGATMRWPDRRGMLSSICAPRKYRQHLHLSDKNNRKPIRKY